MNFGFRRFSLALLARTTRPRLQYMDFFPKVTSVKSGLHMHTSTATLSNLFEKHVDRGSTGGESGSPPAKAATAAEKPLRDRLDLRNTQEDLKIKKEILRRDEYITYLPKLMRLNTEYMQHVLNNSESIQNNTIFSKCETCKKIFLHPAPVNELETLFYQRNGAKSMEQQLEILTDATKFWERRRSHNQLSLAGWDEKDSVRILRNVQGGMDYVRRKSGSRAYVVAYLHACLLFVATQGYYEYDRNVESSDDTKNSDVDVADAENSTCKPSVAAAPGIPIRDGFSSDDFTEDRRILKDIFRMSKEGRTRQEIQASLGLSDKYLKCLLEVLRIANDDGDDVKEKRLIEKCKSCSNVLLNPLPSSKLKTYRKNKAKTMDQQMKLLLEIAAGSSQWDPKEEDDPLWRAWFELEMDNELKSRIQSRTHLIVYLHACLVYVSLNYQENYF